MVHHERKYLLDHYKSFERVYSDIFGIFKEIEKKARLTKIIQKENSSGSNCYKIANVINTFKASKLIRNLIKLIKKTY